MKYDVVVKALYDTQLESPASILAFFICNITAVVMTPVDMSYQVSSTSSLHRGRSPLLKKILMLSFPTSPSGYGPQH